jgi:F0F1-type ATP synthase assembly protein I
MNISPTERKIATIDGAVLSFLFGIVGAGIGAAIDKVFGTNGLFAIAGVCAGTWLPILAAYLTWWNKVTSVLISTGRVPARVNSSARLTRRAQGYSASKSGW